MSPQIDGTSAAGPFRPDEGSFDVPTFLRRQASPPRPATGVRDPGSGGGLAPLRGRIAWSLQPKSLRRGGLDRLAADVADALRQAAAVAEVVALARALGLPPLVVAVALLAQAEAAADRSAARIARVVLADRHAGQVARALLALDL